MEFKQYQLQLKKVSPMIDAGMSDKMKQQLKMRLLIKQKKKQLEMKHQLFELQLQYDPNRIPPDFHMAQNHREANIYGIEQKLRNNTYCHCCCRKVEKQQFNLNCDTNQFAFLGSGIPLFFKFHIYCIIFLMVFLGASGVYNILSSYLYGQDCIYSDKFNQLSKHEQANACLSSYSTSISLGNKISNNQFLEYQNYLNISAIIIMIFMLQIFRRTQRITEVQCNNDDIDAHDYTISVVNLPISDQIVDYDEDLKKYLQKNLEVKEKIKICSINLVYKLQDYYQLREQKEDLIKQKQKALLNYQKYQNFPQNFNIDQNKNKIQEIIQQIKEYEHIFYEGQGSEFMRKYFSGKAFVSFQTEELKDKIVEKYHKQKKNQLIYHGNQIKIMKAVKPTDVNWENQHYEDKELIKKKINSNLTLAFCLIIIFFIISLLQYLSIYYEQTYIYNKVDQNGNVEVVQHDATTHFLLNFIQISIGVIISALNYFLIILCKYLTYSECQQTKTDYKISLAIKLTYALFFNNAICNFIIQLWIGGGRNKYASIFGTSGLVVTQHQIFACNAFFTLIIDYIDPVYLLKQLKIKKLEDSVHRNCVYTQQSLNNLYENPEFDIDIRYAKILNLMFTISFYAPIMPITTLYGILILISYYWLDKLKIIKRASNKGSISNDLSIEMTEMLEFILPIFISSNLFFSYYLLDVTSYSLIITLFIVFIHAILPMQKINKFLCKIAASHIQHVQDYKQSQLNFETDYGRSNPATSQKLKIQFIQDITKEEMEFQQKIFNKQMTQKRNKIDLTQINKLQDKTASIKKKPKDDQELDNSSSSSSSSQSQKNSKSESQNEKSPSQSQKKSKNKSKSQSQKESKIEKSFSFSQQSSQRNNNKKSQLDSENQQSQMLNKKNKKIKSQLDSENQLSQISQQSQQQNKKIKSQLDSESQQSKKQNKRNKKIKSQLDSESQQSNNREKNKKNLKKDKKSVNIKKSNDEQSDQSSQQKTEKWEKEEQSLQQNNTDQQNTGRSLIKKQKKFDQSFSDIESDSTPNPQFRLQKQKNQNSEQSIKSSVSKPSSSKQNNDLAQEIFNQMNSQLNKNRSSSKLNTKQSVYEKSSNPQSQNNCQFIVSDRLEDQNLNRYIQSMEQVHNVSSIYSFQEY